MFSFYNIVVSGMYYSSPNRQVQMTNLPQGPQNTPVANMSNAQNSHGQSLIVQSQPMEMATNAQPLQQVSQQPSTTPMQIQESATKRKKTAAIKIIDPNTGREVIVNNSTQGPPVRYYLLNLKAVESELFLTE